VFTIVSQRKPISQIRKEERILSEGEISKIYLLKKGFQKYASSHYIFKNIPLLPHTSAALYWDGRVGPTLNFCFLDFSASKM
jgi:hypothetical protein